MIALGLGGSGNNYDSFYPDPAIDQGIKNEAAAANNIEPQRAQYLSVNNVAQTTQEPVLVPPDNRRCPHNKGNG